MEWCKPRASMNSIFMYVSSILSGEKNYGNNAQDKCENMRANNITSPLESRINVSPYYSTFGQAPLQRRAVSVCDLDTFQPCQ